MSPRPNNGPGRASLWGWLGRGRRLKFLPSAAVLFSHVFVDDHAAVGLAVHVGGEVAAVDAYRRAAPRFPAFAFKPIRVEDVSVLAREPELLKEAAAAMPKIAFEDIDTLVVDQYGKEISGAGMDPNITGRFLFAPEKQMEGYPHPKKIAILRMTEMSHGNAAGLGIADFVCRRFAEELDLAATYTNSLSSPLCMAKIPMVMNNDSDTIYAAASACGKTEIKDVRIVRIHNTLELDHIWVSENYLPEIEANQSLKMISGPAEMEFGTDDNLIDLP